MKKVILLIISLIFLSGCSNVYNLENFVIPNDTGFNACIKQLETPKIAANYMKKNFTPERHRFYTPNPHTLWIEEKGDCNDLATFGMYAANYHGYEVWRVDIWYNDGNGHSIAVYDEGLLSFTDNSNYSYGWNCINDIVKVHYMQSKYLYYKVYDYNNNLIEEVNNERANN